MNLIDWILGEVNADILTLEYGGIGEHYETPERNDIKELELQLTLCVANSLIDDARIGQPKDIV